MLKNQYLNSVLETVKKRDAGEPEFLQAVEEVLESIEPVIEAHPEYEKVEAPNEYYNHNTCYEDSWFSGAVSKIYTDGANWYYVDSGSTASSFSSRRSP